MRKGKWSEVSSAYDGFYDVTDIRPGNYPRVAGAQVDPLRLLLAPEKEVDMAPSGTVLDGVDLTLEGLPATG